MLVYLLSCVGLFIKYRREFGWKSNNDEYFEQNGEGIGSLCER